MMPKRFCGDDFAPGMPKRTDGTHPGSIFHSVPSRRYDLQARQQLCPLNTLAQEATFVLGARIAPAPDPQPNHDRPPDAIRCVYEGILSPLSVNKNANHRHSRGDPLDDGSLRENLDN
jgi:hypothetical protein